MRPLASPDSVFHHLTDDDESAPRYSEGVPREFAGPAGSPDVAAFSERDAATSGEVLANLRPVGEATGNANGMIFFNPAGHPAISILVGGEFLAIQTFSLPWGMPGLHRGVIVRTMDRNPLRLDAPRMAVLAKRLRHQLYVVK